MSTGTHASLPTAGIWNIDEVHSTATFKLSHNVVTTFRAQFFGVSGRLENNALSGLVPVARLQLPMPVFKDHVLGAGFFDAVNHPNLAFRSRGVRAHDDGTVDVSGDLMIRGVTKQINASGQVSGPVQITQPDGTCVEVVGLDLTATVDRRAFGMVLPGGVGWDVTIEVDLQLTRIRA